MTTKLDSTQIEHIVEGEAIISLYSSLEAIKTLIENVPIINVTTGTWVPVLTSSGPGISDTLSAFGRYKLVDKLCYVTCVLACYKNTLDAGFIGIDGFPFQAKAITNYQQYIPIGSWEGINFGVGYSHITLRISPGSQEAILFQSGDSVSETQITDTNLISSYLITISFSGVYEIE